MMLHKEYLVQMQVCREYYFTADLLRKESIL